ncbi:MAG: hypothetical protein Q8K72_12880, partial [Acidimicrobiales bacterium]|nr:hypothetical protein [Acidimicrobiales bacterium]
MSTPVVSSDPPRGYFSVWQRLMRGYGPLAVFALMILLLSVLVPSKVPETAASTGGPTTDGTDGFAPTGPVSTAGAAFEVAVTGEPTGGN